jgi:hypothetical protein
VAQEAAHAAAAAAGAPRGGGDSGLVRLDIHVVVVLRPGPARRGAGRRRRVGSEERGVVLVAGGHGGVAWSGVRGARAASRSGWRPGREGLRMRAGEAKRIG